MIIFRLTFFPTTLMESRFAAPQIFSAIDVASKENLLKSQTIIACKINDISEQMSITWSGFAAGDNFVASEGTYESGTNSQTGTLTVKPAAVIEDKTYTCTVTSKVNSESASKSMDVKLNVYGM